MLDDIKKTLWATADKLRANMDADKYEHRVLGMIFAKSICNTWSAPMSLHEAPRSTARSPENRCLPDRPAILRRHGRGVCKESAPTFRLPSMRAHHGD